MAAVKFGIVHFLGEPLAKCFATEDFPIFDTWYECVDEESTSSFRRFKGGSSSSLVKSSTSAAFLRFSPAWMSLSAVLETVAAFTHGELDAIGKRCGGVWVFLGLGSMKL